MEAYSDTKHTGMSLQTYMIKTFLWMFAGVGVSFLVGFFISLNEELQWKIATSKFLSIVLFIVQIVVVVAFVSRVMMLKRTTAIVLFFAYSVLTGVTFSVIGIVYAGETIALAFGLACLFFGSLVVIGYTTKRDLSKIGSIAYACLMAMAVYSLLAFIFKWNYNVVIYSVIGLVIFVGITAWDAQKMKEMYATFQYDAAALETISIFSAFNLYLDFINIFLHILQILGTRESKE